MIRFELGWLKVYLKALWKELLGKNLLAFCLARWKDRRTPGSHSDIERMRVDKKAAGMALPILSSALGSMKWVRNFVMVVLSFLPSGRKTFLAFDWAMMTDKRKVVIPTANNLAWCLLY